MMRGIRLLLPLTVALLAFLPHAAAGLEPTEQEAVAADAGSEPIEQDAVAAAARDQFEANVRASIERLGVTGEQQDALRPVLLDHGEAQRAIFEKYVVALDDPDGRRPQIEYLQKMNKALRRNNAKFEKRVAKILSEDQMIVFGQIQEEGRARMRGFFSARRLERIGQQLALTEDQLAEIGPILTEHGETQMGVFEKHDIEVGSRDKVNFRTLLALRQETRAVNARTLRRLSTILSEEQLATYKALQEKQQNKVRARIQ